MSDGKEKAETLLNTFDKKFDDCWLAVPCFCKLCNDSAAKTCFFYSDSKTDDVGGICIIHGLFTKRGIIPLNSLN